MTATMKWVAAGARHEAGELRLKASLARRRCDRLRQTTAEYGPAGEWLEQLYTEVADLIERRCAEAERGV